MVKQEKISEQQFHEVIEKHKGILFKVARTYCKNEIDRQDVIQEMMIQIWKSLHQYNNKFAITTWLYRIALNVSISFYRKNLISQKNKTTLNEQIFPIQEIETTDKELQLQLLEQFIHELNNLDKALMLLYLEDKSNVEIAEILGLSITNVSTKVNRIKEKLKKRFIKFNT